MRSQSRALPWAVAAFVLVAGCSAEQDRSGEVSTGSPTDDAAARSTIGTTRAPSPTQVSASPPTPAATSTPAHASPSEPSPDAEDPSSAAGTEASAAEPEAASPPQATRRPGVAGGIPGAPPLTGASDQALTAVTAAEDTLGGPAHSLAPTQEGGWEVVVLLAGGARLATVSADAEVVDTRSVEADPLVVAVLDQDASLGLRAAVELALAQVGGDVRSARVALGDSGPHWRIEVTGGTSASAIVDTLTGDVSLDPGGR